MTVAVGTDVQLPTRPQRYYRRVSSLPYVVAIRSRHMKEAELYWIEARTARLAAHQAARLAGADKEDVVSATRFLWENP
ncbi:MAG: hypothetical protein ABI191_05105 [Rhizomicrobium sp.]